MSTNWQEVTLGDIGSKTRRAFSMGPFGSNIKSDNYRDSGVPVIRGVNLGDVGDAPFSDRGLIYVDDAKADQLSSSQAFPNDIVFVAQGTVGKVGLVPTHNTYRRFLLSQNLMKVSVDLDIADPAYVFYYFRSTFGQHEIGSRVNSTGVPCISQPLTSLRSFKIILPPLADQRAIASILGALDDKIELNRKMSATLEAIARALFKSWFVDFDPVRAKAEGRDTSLAPEIATLFPDSFEDSELGKIPKGWAIEHVGSIANVSRSTINPAVYPDELLLHYSIPAFDDGRSPVKETGSQIRSNKFLVLRDSVLLSRLNPRTARVWMPEVDGVLRSICSTEFAVMMPRATSREWLYGLLSSAKFCERLATMVTGTSGSHQRVKPESLDTVPVISPPESVAERFTELAGPALLRARHAISESNTLANIRDVLLPRLISGQLRVGHAERLMEQSA